MKKEELATLYPTESVSYKLVNDDGSTMTFEGGWWMKKSDWRIMWIEDRSWRKDYGQIRKTPRPDIGMDRNQRTHQITIFLIPNTNNQHEGN